MFNTIKNILRSFGGIPLASPSIWSIFPIIRSSAGVPITRDSVFQLPAFWRGVDLIASTCARVSCPVYRRGDDNDNTELQDHAAYRLLNKKANPYQTSFVWRRQMFVNAIIAGGGFSVIKTDAYGDPDELYILDSFCTYPVVVWNKDRPSLYYVTTIGGEQLTYQPEEIIYIRGLGNTNGFFALRFIDYLQESLGTAIATQQHAGNYFRYGGAVNQWIEVPDYFSDTIKLEEFRKSIEEKHEGSINTNKKMILQGGMKLHTETTSANDLQLTEARAFSLVDIANGLSLPAHKLNSAVNTSYASIEAENLSLLSDCYEKWLVNAETEFQDKLLREDEKDTVYIEHDRHCLTRGDSQAEHASLLNDLNNGGISWEEYRQKRNLPTDRNPDQIWRMPANIMEVGDDDDDDEQPQPVEGDATTDTTNPQAAIAPGATVPLNGAQVEAAIDLVEAAASGTLPRDSALSMLQAFFGLTSEQATNIMGSVGLTPPKPVEVVQENSAADEGNNNSDDDEEKDIELRAIMRNQVVRLQKRLLRDKHLDDLNKHRTVFDESLPPRIVSDLWQELEAVLPEQRKTIIEEWNVSKIVEGIWSV